MKSVPKKFDRRRARHLARATQRKRVRFGECALAEQARSHRQTQQLGQRDKLVRRPRVEDPLARQHDRPSCAAQRLRRGQHVRRIAA
jgi:hypothetical protein